MQYRSFSVNLDKLSMLALGALALGLAGCGGGDESEAVPTYAEVAKVLGVDGSGQSSCSTATCHAAGVGGLTLTAGTNLVDIGVGMPACEAPELDLIDPGNPESSWLYIKLAGEIEDPVSGDLVVQPSWGESGNCPNAPGFGKRMPRVAPFSLSEEDLSLVYEWIKGGAPGPM